MATTATETADAGHAHKMGPLLAAMLVAGNMIGSGVYLLPVTLATVGSISIVGWIVAGVGALVLAAVFAFLSRLKPDAHGLVDYVSEALGRFFGFEATFAYWLACVVGNLAVAVAAVGYLGFFFPALKDPLISACATAGVIWVLTLANIIGPRFIGSLHGASLAIGLLPIFAAAVLGWMYFDADLFRASWNVSGKTGLATVSASLVLVFWAFLGLESASVCARVVRDPAKNVPLATFGGVALAALIYIAASAAVFGALPAAALAQSTAPFADVVDKFLGAGVAAVVAACAVFKATGTLGGWVMVTAQTTQAATQSGYLPRILSRPGQHPHTVPVRELLLLALLMTAIAFLTVQPTIGQSFNVLINVATNLQLAAYSLCCVALLRFAGGLQRGRTVARIAAVAGLAFSLAVMAVGDLELLKVQGWLFLFSLPLYAIVWRAARPKTAPAST